LTDKLGVFFITGIAGLFGVIFQRAGDINSFGVGGLAGDVTVQPNQNTDSQINQHQYSQKIQRLDHREHGQRVTADRIDKLNAGKIWQQRRC